jgi:hypothetical protein
VDVDGIRKAWNAAGWLVAIAAGPHGIAIKLLGIGFLMVLGMVLGTYRGRTGVSAAVPGSK